MDKFGSVKCVLKILQILVLARGRLELPHDTLGHDEEWLLLNNLLQIVLKIKVPILNGVMKKASINYNSVRRFELIHYFEVVHKSLVFLSSFNPHIY